jgi:antibiotic biosynthesis monooxygenase (ABM) superfamily enzyme
MGGQPLAGVYHTKAPLSFCQMKRGHLLLYALFRRIKIQEAGFSWRLSTSLTVLVLSLIGCSLSVWFFIPDYICTVDQLITAFCLM